MTKILRNVQCFLLGLKDFITWQPHTSHRSPGIIPKLYMSLNLNIRHKEPVHSWKISTTLFPLDLDLILWYFRPLHKMNVNFAINLTLAKKFIGRFITYFTVIQTKTYIFRISTFPKSICDKTTANKCSSLSKIPFFGRGNSFSPYITF